METDKIKPKNMDMELLFSQTIGILAVICGHYSPINTTIKSFFTYYSWHMPFFISLSGILFAKSGIEKNYFKYLWGKCRTLLFPALFVNFCYGIISYVMRYYKIVKYGKNLSFDTLFLSPFMDNYQFQNDISLWFIFQLFIIEIIVKTIYKIPPPPPFGYQKIKIFDLVLLCTSFFLSFICINLSKKGTNYSRETLLLGRTGFLTFFFIFGLCYEKYLKQYIGKKIEAITGCYIVLALHSFVLFVTNWNPYYNTRNMNTNNLSNSFLPFFTFLTAFTFIICLSRWLSPLLSKSRMLEFIGPNLRYVVYHHQFFGILIGLFALILCASGKENLLYIFEPTDFLKNRWYAATFVGNGFGKIPYLILPFFGPLLTAKLINKLPHRLMRFLGWCIALVLSLIVIMIVGISLREYLGTL